MVYHIFGCLETCPFLLYHFAKYHKAILEIDSRFHSLYPPSIRFTAYKQNALIGVIAAYVNNTKLVHPARWRLIKCFRPGRKKLLRILIIQSP